MFVFVLVILVYFVTLLLPFIIAGLAYGKGKPVYLQIKDDNVKDPRYFSKSFRALMDKALEHYDGSGEIMLSKKEKLVTPPFMDNTVDGIVWLKDDFTDTEERLYLSEVYCMGSARFAADSSFRAIAGKGKLELGENTEIIRWADSDEELICGFGCDLGVSVSSAKQLRVLTDSTFLRMYAPVILVGSAVGPDYTAPRAVPEQRGEGVERTHKVEEQSIVTTDLISTGNLMIESDAVVLGSVKANKDIHVCSGAVIMGNLVADGTIVIDEGVYIGGSVFSQESVYLGRYCQIGRGHQIKSLIAQENIYICENAKIFGYVSCEKGGKIVDYDEFMKVTNDCY